VVTLARLATASCPRPRSVDSQATAHKIPFAFDFALRASSVGKGVWGGLGGMLKQWLRTRIVSALSYDLNSGDPDPLAAN